MEASRFEDCRRGGVVNNDLTSARQEARRVQVNIDIYSNYEYCNYTVVVALPCVFTVFHLLFRVLFPMARPGLAPRLRGLI